MLPAPRPSVRVLTSVVNERPPTVNTTGFGFINNFSLASRLSVVTAVMADCGSGASRQRLERAQVELEQEGGGPEHVCYLLSGSGFTGAGAGPGPADLLSVLTSLSDI